MDLSHNNLRSCSCKILGEWLKQFQVLTYLDLSSNALNDDGARHLCTSLPFVSALQVLHCRECGFGNCGWNSIILALEQNQVMTNVNGFHIDGLWSGRMVRASLSKYEFEACFPLSVVEYLVRSAETLTFLDLSFNRLGDQWAFMSFLSSVPKLQSFNMSNNLIGPVGMDALGPELANLRFLTELDLSYNHLGPEGGILLGIALVKLTMLSSLNLRDNYVGSSGGTAVSIAVLHLTRLEILQYQFNDLGDEAGLELCRSLTNLTRLRIFWINHNSLGDDVVRRIGRSLVPLTCLKSLCLTTGNNSQLETRKDLQNSLCFVGQWNDVDVTGADFLEGGW
eukprot:CAMPEP_0113693950 /NCGR_PEP_ID=MMETSP0038_2-20120614/19976_1 /TAXON_ID=2898 /ORGANISM="Cryptomonas paramecium" /LENGTH=337 /DNA_ID=CAMNT_0000616133 /DNA_START=164 /DNA_END=1177 /DNA_ORIENTATION=+ /assembly_acc=CAM_ASM_000170